MPQSTACALETVGARPSGRLGHTRLPGYALIARGGELLHPCGFYAPTRRGQPLLAIKPALLPGNDLIARGGELLHLCGFSTPTLRAIGQCRRLGLPCCPESHSSLAGASSYILAGFVLQPVGASPCWRLNRPCYPETPLSLAGRAPTSLLVLCPARRSQPLLAIKPARLPGIALIARGAGSYGFFAMRLLPQWPVMAGRNMGQGNLCHAVGTDFGSSGLEPASISS